jgi:hypothetical protein
MRSRNASGILCVSGFISFLCAVCVGLSSTMRVMASSEEISLMDKRASQLRKRQMPNNSSARRNKKEKKRKKKDAKPLSKQVRSASADSSSSSSSQAAEEAGSVRTIASSRASVNLSLSFPFTAAGKAGRNPPSSRETMDSSASSLSQFSSLAESKGNKSSHLKVEDEDSGEATDTTSDEDDVKKSQVKPLSSSQDQNRHFAKLLTRSKSKDDLK